MQTEEERVDLSIQSVENREKAKRQAHLVFKLNHTMPMTDEYNQILYQLFENKIGEGSYIAPPLQVVCADKVSIGKNVYINGNSLMMSRGTITIEDDVQIAANVSLLSNNHDPYERQILLCKPVIIKKGVWIGAGASVLPGVTIGKYAIIGAASVVTHDIPDYAVAVGNPARVIKMLDASRFER